MKLKIVVVQFKTRKFIPEENLPYVEKFIKKASKSKADLIVFPEAFLSRNCSFKKEFSYSERKGLIKIKALAKKYSIGIIAGSIIEYLNKKKHNTSYYIDSNGKIKGKYQKEHLWINERGIVKKGKHTTVINLKHIKIGLILCWDLMFPEIFRNLKKKGAEIIICPANWSYQDAREGLKYNKDSEVKLIDSLCIERAFEEEIILIFCNTAGEIQFTKTKDTSVGHSQITEPFKGVIKKLNHNKEAMFIHEIDTSILKDAEKAYKLRKDINK